MYFNFLQIMPEIDNFLHIGSWKKVVQNHKKIKNAHFTGLYLKNITVFAWIDKLTTE